MKASSTPAAALLLALAAALVAAPAARAAQDETGPNFAVPADLPAEARTHWEQGLAAYAAAREATSGQTDKMDAAIKELKKARELAPRFAPPLYYLGILYQWTKEFERARGLLKQACEINPGFHQAMVELGDTYMWLKQPERAMAAYDRAIAIKPDYPHAYLMRGLARMRAADFKAALADFETARKHDPKDETLSKVADMAGREIEGPKWPQVFVCETPNYVVKTPVNQELADEIGKHAELIYKTYTKIFPKISKEKRKFKIIVYGSAEDYHADGGPPDAGGHYESLVRKLVFFRYPDDRNTRLVLYHEGFHQFLHDYIEDAPQWFNEGLADFFGPSHYIAPVRKGPRGKMTAESMELRPNPWRLKHIQAAIKAGRIRGWKKLMLMSQAELYEPQWAGIHYAESWSIIYFLIRGGAPPGAEAGPYFKLLKDYFSALRRGDGQESAYDATFGRVDVASLETAWKQFIMGLPPEE